MANSPRAVLPYDLIEEARVDPTAHVERLANQLVLVSILDAVGVSKQVAMNTLGAHAEFMLREYLSRAGLSPEEAKKVTLVVLPPVNTEQALRAGNIDVASLTGIFRDKALVRGGLRVS